MDSVIIPKVEVVTLTDRKSGKTYDVELFISGNVGLRLLNKLECIGKIFNHAASDDDIDAMFDIFEIVLARQYKFMNKKWCEDNLDLASTMALTMSIAEPMFEYLKMTGMPVTPDTKNLESDESSDGKVM